MTNSDNSQHDLFLRWFTTTEPALRGFVRSLVPSTTDADDVLQEVAITLWKKFDEFSGLHDEDFRRWAFGVAKFKVLSWKRDHGRDRLVFSDDLTAVLAVDAEAKSDKLSAQREALTACLKKLAPEQKSLVETAYAPASRIDGLAAKSGRTAMSLYKQLHRIRISLIACTQQELRKEGW